MTETWTDERLAFALDGEATRIERLREDAVRGKAALACARLLSALHREREGLALLGEAIERAALHDDVGALAQAQQELQQHRDRTRALHGQLELLSAQTHLDLLTQCVDRIGFDEALAREWARAARDGAAVGLVVVDVGADAPGLDAPSAADALRALGRSLQVVVAGPAGTVTARIGTSRLAALVPQAALAEVLAIGERVRTAAQGSGAGGDQVAIGVTALDPAAGWTPDVLIERAEAAAVRAAALGRGCAVAAGADAFFVPQDARGRASGTPPTPRRGR